MVNAVYPIINKQATSMTSDTQRVHTEALAMPAEQRALLAHELIVSLGEPEALTLDDAYEQELQRRLQAVRSGSASARPADEVFARIEAQLR